MLGVEYCTGYVDETGTWRKGFYCPKKSDGSGSLERPKDIFCCGTQTSKYCCERKEGFATSQSGFYVRLVLATAPSSFWSLVLTKGCIFFPLSPPFALSLVSTCAHSVSTLISVTFVTFVLAVLLTALAFICCKKYWKEQEGNSSGHTGTSGGFSGDEDEETMSRFRSLRDSHFYRLACSSSNAPLVPFSPSFQSNSGTLNSPSVAVATPNATGLDVAAAAVQLLSNQPNSLLLQSYPLLTAYTGHRISSSSNSTSNSTSIGVTSLDSASIVQAAIASYLNSSTVATSDAVLPPPSYPPPPYESHLSIHELADDTSSNVNSTVTTESSSAPDVVTVSSECNNSTSGTSSSSFLPSLPTTNNNGIINNNSTTTTNSMALTTMTTTTATNMIANNVSSTSHSVTSNRTSNCSTLTSSATSNNNSANFLLNCTLNSSSNSQHGAISMNNALDSHNNHRNRLLSQESASCTLQGNHLRFHTNNNNCNTHGTTVGINGITSITVTPMPVVSAGIGSTTATIATGIGCGGEGIGHSIEDPSNRSTSTGRSKPLWRKLSQ